MAEHSAVNRRVGSSSLPRGVGWAVGRVADCACLENKYRSIFYRVFESHTARHALVAQRIEQLPSKQWVAGSNPAKGVYKHRWRKWVTRQTANLLIASSNLARCLAMPDSLVGKTSAFGAREHRFEPCSGSCV